MFSIAVGGESLAPSIDSSIQEAQARLQSQQELEQEIRPYRSILLRQLTRKVGAIDDRYLAQIDQLSTQQTAALGEDLLDFRAIDNLTNWLKNQE
jgi:hypothetical protein